jgi:hypothetical protein
MAINFDSKMMATLVTTRACLDALEVKNFKPDSATGIFVYFDKNTIIVYSTYRLSEGSGKELRYSFIFRSNKDVKFYI